jgi:hypothetical protein
MELEDDKIGWDRIWIEKSQSHSLSLSYHQIRYSTSRSTSTQPQCNITEKRVVKGDCSLIILCHNRIAPFISYDSSSPLK